MKFFRLSLLFLFALNFSFSQSSRSSDMIVSVADLKMESYELDTDADAVILYEKGESFVDKKTFKLKTKITKKVKIFNEQGFKFASLVIPLYRSNNGKEEVGSIKGTTHNLIDGDIKKVQLEESRIFREERDENFTLAKFTFPNIRPGSVVTYSYIITSPFFYKFYEWEFQAEIPKVYSEYFTSIPGNWHYNIKLVGSLNFDDKQEELERACLETSRGGYSDCANSTYVMKEIPAIKEEAYMTTIDNYLSRIEYELKTFRNFDGLVNNITKTWKTVDHEIMTDTDLGKELRRKGVAKGELDNIDLANLSNLDKAQEIYYYVQEKFRNNDKFHLLRNVSTKDLVSTGTGSTTDKNLLLFSMLNEIGLDVNPVLISTRKHGFITKIFPVLSDFNYLLVKVTIDNETYFLDANEKLLSFGEIPFNALNQYGRQINFDSESVWVDIAPRTKTMQQYSANLRLGENDSINGGLKMRYTGYEALDSKQMFFSDSTKYKEFYVDKYENPRFYNHKVEADKKDVKFQESFDITYSPDRIGNKILVNPILINLFEENPFKMNKRTYPIDFGFTKSLYYSTNITITDDFDIETMPENKLIALPNNTGTLAFSSKYSGNKIYISLVYDFKEAIYAPEYYESLKNIVASIIEIQENSLVVLKKK